MSKSVRKSRRGETYVDTGVKILAAVVCGALILGSVFWILKDTVLKNVKTSVADMFNGPDINPLEDVMWEPGVDKVSSTGALWTMEGNTLTRYKGTLTAGMSLVIPNEVDGVRVIRIQNDETVASDATKRFNIFGATDNTTVASITISEGIKEIGDCAFFKCTGIKGTVLLPDMIRYVGDRAFDGCTGINGNLILPDSLKTIGDAAFQNCVGLTGNLVFPDSVEKIGTAAFNKCSGFTGDLVLPDGLKTLGMGAFQLVGCSGTLTLSGSLTAIPDYAFSQSNLSGTLTLPSGLTSIGAYAFNKCKFTGNLILPSGLINIGRTAFQAVAFTGSLVIPVGVTVIDEYVFNSCKFDGSLTLPSSLTKIGKAAFNLNPFTGLLNLPAGVIQIGEGAFQNNKFTGPLNLPENLTTIDAFAFYGSTFTGQLVLPESITLLGPSCFKLCSSFQNTTIAIPKNVSNIGAAAFYGTASSTLLAMTTDPDNHSFEAVNGVLYDEGMTRLIKYPQLKTDVSYSVPEGVTTIDQNGMDRLVYLKNLHLPNSLLYTKASFSPYENVEFCGTSFYCSTSLESVTVNDNHPWLKSVDGVLFNKAMTTIVAYPISKNPGGTYTIPSTVTYVGQEAFNYCKLNTVYVPAASTAHADAFYASAVKQIKQ